MDAKKLESVVPTIIRNEAFYAFARVCMILCLPVMGFFFHRLINAADDTRAQIDKQNIAIVRLTDKVEYRFGALDDHEQRLRRIERRVALEPHN